MDRWRAHAAAHGPSVPPAARALSRLTESPSRARTVVPMATIKVKPRGLTVATATFQIVAPRFRPARLRVTGERTQTKERHKGEKLSNLFFLNQTNQIIKTALKLIRNIVLISTVTRTRSTES